MFLANDFLPVVLLQQIVSTNNNPGLIIGDLRATPLPAPIMTEVHHLIVQTLDMRLTIKLYELAA